MVYLNKENLLLKRNDEGNLLPVEVKVNLDKNVYGSDTIKVLPLTKGQLQEIQSNSTDGNTNKDQDNQIILKQCVNPEFTEEEVKFIKPNISAEITKAILSLSLGITQEEFSKVTVGDHIDTQDSRFQ